MSAAFVLHVDLEAVLRLIAAVSEGHPRTGERDGLLIALLFDACLRVSEAISLRPRDLTRTSAGGWVSNVTGKDNKTAQAVLSASLVANLHSYAYRTQITPDRPSFPVSRVRVHQIMQEAFEKAGIAKPEHVGAVHVLRHSGAIARLEQTGNPKSLQDQLRHQDARMTLRYLKTVSAKRILEIQPGSRNPLNKSGTTAILCWNRAWLRRGLGQSNNLFRGFLDLILRPTPSQQLQLKTPFRQPSTGFWFYSHVKTVAIRVRVPLPHGIAPTDAQKLTLPSSQLQRQLRPPLVLVWGPGRQQGSPPKDLLGSHHRFQKLWRHC